MTEAEAMRVPEVWTQAPDRYSWWCGLCTKWSNGDCHVVGKAHVKIMKQYMQDSSYYEDKLQPMPMPGESVEEAHEEVQSASASSGGMTEVLARLADVQSRLADVQSRLADVEGELRGVRLRSRSPRMVPPRSR